MIVCCQNKQEFSWTLLFLVLLDLFFFFFLFLSLFLRLPAIEVSKRTSLCNYLDNKFISCSLIDFERRKLNRHHVKVNKDVSSKFFLIDIYSRLDTHQPVSVQPGTSDDVYTFANHWHRSMCGSFTPCYRGVLMKKIFLVKKNSLILSIFF